ncbi:MAG: CRTAC1 family protein [Acidobacteria bacterium]|nr:CRTAC1 family protein [Acidobacteriota bacterium]
MFPARNAASNTLSRRPAPEQPCSTSTTTAGRICSSSTGPGWTASARPGIFSTATRGGLTFEDATDRTGLKHTGWAQGVCAGDFDNDGWTDLLVTNWGENTLWRNAKGRFSDETRQRGLWRGRSRWSTDCSFVDYDRDGDLDLFVVHYLDLDLKTTPKPGDKAQCQWKGLPVVCGPRGLPGETMSIYQNDGRGTFTDVSAKAGITGQKQYYGFTALVSDFDNDGWPDLYVACDSTASLFYRNRRNGTFEETGVISGTALNEDGREQAGMGATAGDFDGDGLLDIFKTNFSDDTPTLYRNLGDGNFQDVTVQAGLGVNTKFLGWGAAFLDFDHDGRRDIFHVNGHVYPEVDSASIGEKFEQPRVLYWNRGDKQYHDLSAISGPGFGARHSSRGLAIGDLDNNGQVELAIVKMHEAPSLLKNAAAPAGNALLVEAITAHGRAAIGARITVTTAGKTQIDGVRSGGYHISQSDFRVHFGLGSAVEAQLAIRWPDGTVQVLGPVPAGHWITVQQGKGMTRRQPFRRNEKKPIYEN